MTTLSWIHSGSVQNNISSAGKKAGTCTRDCDRFDAILHNSVSGVPGEAPLEKNTLEALVRLIEEQVRTHYIHSLQTITGGISSGPWGAGFSPLSAMLLSTHQHSADQAQDVSTTPEMIDRIIDHSSETHGVDVDLIRAVVRAESNFDPRATSPKGAMGLMQLMPETAKDLGVTNPYDPAQNVAAGTRYLKTLLDRYDGNTNAALAAYNWGMGNVERNPGRLPEETKTYIARVTHYRDQVTA